MRLALLVAACVCMAGCAPDPPVDFACTQGLIIEDIEHAWMRDGIWLVQVQSGIYGYRPHAGELCAAMP